MSKFKQWFLNKYLPAYCKEKLIEENNKLFKKYEELKAENKSLKAYIDGLEMGLKSVRRIQIINKGD